MGEGDEGGDGEDRKQDMQRLVLDEPIAFHDKGSKSEQFEQGDGIAVVFDAAEEELLLSDLFGIE